jgi:hypothetical protein
LDEAKAYLERAVLDTAGCMTIRTPRYDFWHFEALPLGSANAVASLQAQMKNFAGEAAFGGTKSSTRQMQFHARLN